MSRFQFEFENGLLSGADIPNSGMLIVIEEHRFLVSKQIEEMIILTDGIAQVYAIHMSGIRGNEITFVIEIGGHYRSCLRIVVAIDDGVALEITL